MMLVRQSKPDHGAAIGQPQPQLFPAGTSGHGLIIGDLTGIEADIDDREPLFRCDQRGGDRAISRVDAQQHPLHGRHLPSWHLDMLHVVLSILQVQCGPK